MREGIQKDGCGNHRSLLSSSTASLCYWEFIARASEVRFPPLEEEEGVRALAACGVNLPGGAAALGGCRQGASLCLVGLLEWIDSREEREHSQRWQKTKEAWTERVGLCKSTCLNLQCLGSR